MNFFKLLYACNMLRVFIMPLEYSSLKPSSFTLQPFTNSFFCGKRSATFTEKLSILVFEQPFVLHQVIVLPLKIPLHFLLLRCRWKISLFGNRGWTGKMFRLLGQVIASWRFYCDWFVLASQGKWVHNIKILCCELEATLNCQTMFLLSGFSMATSTVAMLMT